MNKIFIFIFIILLISCGKKSSPVAGDPHQDQIEENFNLFDSNKKLIAAEPNSPYFKNIAKCALQKEGTGCTPEKVPLLGMRGQELNTDYILKNTIVSHAFLADSFKDYLSSMNNKYLFALFGSVSGVVITDEISSSFYYKPTGMVYINAYNLWKSQEEFAKLKFKKDKRFSRDIRKKIYTDLDYVKDNKTIYSEVQIKERSLRNLSPGLTKLFFHELTHANDIYPADQLVALDKFKNYSELAIYRYDSKELVSRKIVYPKTDKIWEYALFFVLNKLVTPKSHLFTKTDFLEDFVPNIGIVLYSYISNREHLAMMMENYFMLFTEYYETCTYGGYKESKSKSEFFWFQKNRILQPNILLEARNAIDLMLPSALALELKSINTAFSLKTVTDINPNGPQPTCKNY